jgi:predicted HTH transcriptional regulator
MSLPPGLSEICFIETNKAVLVLGISKQGEIKGFSHLLDQQRNSITNISAMLANQAASVKLIDCQNESGVPDNICLIFVPYTEYAICETFNSFPKAWLRQGAQNILMNQSQREQLRRDKRIVDYEQAYCCPYDPKDVDQAVLKEFRESYSSLYEYNSEEFLYQIGALTRHDQDYAFTNAGFLFFASNPQRRLTTAYIRLLRFEATIEDIEQRGLPTFERSFSGPLTKQIRDMRTFIKETGFFKTYQWRNRGGGFIEEPEYPYISVDEAIVNAVAHRDYAVSLPIECEAYRGTFLVRNPGRIIQRDRDVPEHFSLENIQLVSTPRNPKLIEWLKIIRDAQGIAFIRALSEGTKRMWDEMLKLHLPAPTYDQGVTVFCKAPAREECNGVARIDPRQCATSITSSLSLRLHDFMQASIGAMLNSWSGFHATAFSCASRSGMTAASCIRTGCEPF